MVRRVDLVDALGGEVLEVLPVDLEHRSRAAARQALGCAQRDPPVGSGLPGADAELLLALPENVARTPKRAGEGLAYPDLVLADRVLVEETVERDGPLHLRRREVEARRDELDNRVVDVAMLLLAEMKQRDARRCLGRVLREKCLELTLAFGGQGEGHLWGLEGML